MVPSVAINGPGFSVLEEKGQEEGKENLSKAEKEWPWFE